jgi:hypothetical protein
LGLRRHGFKPCLSLLMSAFSLPIAPRTVTGPLRCNWNAFLLLPVNWKAILSVCRLSPDHFRRELTRWVSYYALFKWWLPLSQHPHCLCKFTSFSTERHLGTLSDGLGCFPLDDEAYPPPSDCQVMPRGIRSLIEFGTRVRALAHSVLYLRG